VLPFINFPRVVGSEHSDLHGTYLTLCQNDKFLDKKILAGVRTAQVDVNVSEDGKQYTITVVSPTFENLPPFKRRDLVQKSLGTVRQEIPSFAASQIKELHVYSPSEISEIQSQQQIEQ
jgi:acid stress-induced BolA-like protein IbaG/YrbA